MTRIALVTEGKSEHWVIKHIIQHYLKEKEIFFRQIQPQIVDEKQESTGGWLEVLKFCQRTEDIRSALIETDYLIIQIDTDESPKPGFGVPHTKDGGRLKSHEELFDEIIAKLNEIIDPSIENLLRKKIIFAICIHSIECWLLPIYLTNHHRYDTTNCMSTINNELRRKNLKTIPQKKQTLNRQRVYESILRNWKRKQEIESSAQFNEGFRRFVNSLSEVLDTI